MRHASFGRKLSRDTNARKALLNNLASLVLEKGQITTTLAKAKFAGPYVEKIITKAKRQSDLNSQRLLASQLTKQAFSKLNSNFAPGFSSRTGGYTRIIKLNRRTGDGTLMARLELLKIEKPKKPSSKDSSQKITKEKKTKNEKS